MHTLGEVCRNTLKITTYLVNILLSSPKFFTNEFARIPG